MKKNILLALAAVMFSSVNAHAIASLNCNEMLLLRYKYAQKADNALKQIKELQNPIVNGDISEKFQELLQVLETNLINRAGLDISECENESGH